MTESLDPKMLLAAYDQQLRTVERDTREGVLTDWDGPAVRSTGGATGGFLEYKDLAGLTGAALDTFIARQINYFGERGERFEWKTRGHDLPADLPDRLIAAGFVPEERETVLIGLASAYADPAPLLGAGLTIRATTSPEDFDRIAEMKTLVWGIDLSWIAESLQADLATGNVKIYLAEAGDRVVSAAWIRFVPGTEFAGLWGGSTLQDYRGRGLYKALVAVRAADAVTGGYRYLQVDASDDSRPILERLGFVAITTTTPYIWSPVTVN